MGAELSAVVDTGPDRAAVRFAVTLVECQKSDDPGVLASIREAGVSLAVWTRELPKEVDDWLVGLDPDAVGDIDVSCPPRQIDTALAEALHAAGYDDIRQAQWLRADILDLVRRFAAITSARSLSVRLEVVETDACRRFHADFVTARLIATYRGPGTQWLTRYDAARLAGGAPLDSLVARQLPTGSVALMKGRCWDAEAPLVHRSPPIADKGTFRLVLTVDAVTVDQEGA